jgi:hypothetical protein
LEEGRARFQSGLIEYGPIIAPGQQETVPFSRAPHNLSLSPHGGRTKVADSVMLRQHLHT